MLCSIPSSRSSDGWLDRLRASKGYPAPSDLDLEQFLHSNFEPNPNATPPDDVGPTTFNPPDQTKEKHSHKRMECEKEQCLFDLMSNVLSELFVMGDPQESGAGRKNARKQMNPKACVSSVSASTDVGASRQVPAMSPSSADNSIAEVKDRKKMKRMRTKSGHPGLDPSVNTGTIVTVIDTSSPEWKTEKHFRRGMAWKGREKKVWSVCRKKRKLVVEKEKLLPLTELKGSEQNKNVKSYNEGFTSNFMGDTAKGSDFHTQIPRRLKFLRSPRLPVKNSSIFRLQVITKNHKSVLLGLRDTHKAKS